MKSSEKIRVTQRILERLKNNVLKFYEHVICMEDSRWPKRLMTWSLGGRRGRRQPEVKCDEETEKVMKQRNLTTDDTTNWQLWQLTNSNQ
jgi:hypothetical protein